MSIMLVILSALNSISWFIHGNEGAGWGWLVAAIGWYVASSLHG
jgi:hypothetical protein